MLYSVSATNRLYGEPVQGFVDHFFGAER